jgi:hypothetical protein
MDVKLVKDEEVGFCNLLVAAFKRRTIFQVANTANILFSSGVIRTQHVLRARRHPRRKHHRQNPQLLQKLEVSGTRECQ